MPTSGRTLTGNGSASAHAEWIAWVAVEEIDAAEHAIRRDIKARRRELNRRPADPYEAGIRPACRSVQIIGGLPGSKSVREMSGAGHRLPLRARAAGVENCVVRLRALPA